VEKIKEDNQNTEKRSQIVSQTPTPKLEYNKNSSTMGLKYPRHSEMEF
jgi:hypothetical protein